MIWCALLKRVKTVHKHVLGYFIIYIIHLDHFVEICFHLNIKAVLYAKIKN